MQECKRHHGGGGGDHRQRSNEAAAIGESVQNVRGSSRREQSENP
jgi:hypothetical protein